jgi:hypothetical protein
VSSPRLSILKNDRLYASVLAEEGGRVVSLRSADTGLEFLLQPQHPCTLEGTPYLGLWLCYGGWPDNGAPPFQYTVALEPAVAPCGTLQEAQEQKTAIDLAPSASFRWSIDFQVTPERLSFDEFHDRCAHQQPYPV